MVLTEKIIDQLHENKIHWDESLRGFGVRVYPSGNKVYVLRYRHNNREHRIALGSCNSLSLKQARGFAKKLIGESLDGGTPLDARNADRVGQNLGELCDYYIEEYAKKRKKSWKKDEQFVRLYIKPHLGMHPISSISREDIEKLHRKIGQEKQITANRTLEVLRKMFNLARTRGILSSPNPTAGVSPFPERKRARYITKKEASKIFQAIAEEANPYTRAAFLMLFLTGCRKNEMLSAKWEHVDWANQLIHLPNTKSGRDHHVPLTDEAIQILRSLDRAKENPYIFVGHRTGQHLVNIDKNWATIKVKAGTPDLRIHDIRRTLASWLVQRGTSLHLVGKILNQSTQHITASYAQFAQRDERKALTKHAKLITRIQKQHQDKPGKNDKADKSSEPQGQISPSRSD